MFGILFTMMNMVTDKVTTVNMNNSYTFYVLLLYVALVCFLTIYIKIIILLECKLNTCMNKNIESQDIINKLTKDIQCKDDTIKQLRDEALLRDEVLLSVVKR